MSRSFTTLLRGNMWPSRTYDGGKVTILDLFNSNEVSVEEMDGVMADLGYESQRVEVRCSKSLELKLIDESENVAHESETGVNENTDTGNVLVDAVNTFEERDVEDLGPICFKGLALAILYKAKYSEHRGGGSGTLSSGTKGKKVASKKNTRSKGNTFTATKKSHAKEKMLQERTKQKVKVMFKLKMMQFIQVVFKVQSSGVEVVSSSSQPTLPTWTKNEISAARMIASP
ncbi:hypothetical protein Tco_0195251 [Tanacetum coccineum]